MSLKIYLENADRDKYPSVKDHTPKEERANTERFLKDFLTKEDKALSIIELLTKYKDEIEDLASFDKDTKDVFGYYNTWWVFGEVAKQQDYSIFMAEAENVGYKRTKRGEKPQPNDLYDIEIAPQTIEKKRIIAEYDKNIDVQNEDLVELNKTKTALEKKKEDLAADPKANKRTVDKTEKDLDTCIAETEKVQNTIAQLTANKAEVERIATTYYQETKGTWTIKEEYYDRTDAEFLTHFQSGGLLENEASQDVLLRKHQEIKLLDIIRKEVSWA